MKRVLVLGAGLVSRPLVRYLLEKDCQVTVATRTVSKAEKILDGHPNGRACTLNVQDEEKVASLIKECDLAISLVSFDLHPTVARLCIAHKKHMVTTSYVSAEMQALNADAQGAGVTILNEVGVDPGIDHMSAMRVIDDVRGRGGKVVSFRSYCGGLPAPEANDNPFGYKFSWAPRGVLLASRNNAQYLLDGRRIDVPGERLFRDMHVLQVEGQGDYEAYPNRDSLGYIEIYGLEGIRTMYRGTLRNMGWCDTVYSIGQLGLLSTDEVDVGGKCYADLMRGLVGCDPGADLVDAIAAKLGTPRDAFPILNLKWLGLFSEKRFEADRISPLDALGNLMYEKLAYGPGERDMIVLYHDFLAEFPGGKRERINSSLFSYGIPNGDSAMARTVSLPAAVAVRLILDGQITATGVLRPVKPDIYTPVLDELATLDIVCREEAQTL
jgi:saccharopine dehydrogenase-like NADP-dependent oxidoreductase